MSDEDPYETTLFAVYTIMTRASDPKVFPNDERLKYLKLSKGYIKRTLNDPPDDLPLEIIPFIQKFLNLKVPKSKTPPQKTKTKTKKNVKTPSIPEKPKTPVAPEKVPKTPSVPEKVQKTPVAPKPHREDVPEQPHDDDETTPDLMPQRKDVSEKKKKKKKKQNAEKENALWQSYCEKLKKGSKLYRMIMTSEKEIKTFLESCRFSTGRGKAGTTIVQAKELNRIGRVKPDVKKRVQEAIKSGNLNIDENWKELFYLYCVVANEGTGIASYNQFIVNDPDPSVTL
jgi:hypothetical protein